MTTLAPTTSRRLPGVRFVAQPPPPAEVLPRMDVAAFVGFAASGPLHVPVVVEDAARFAQVFGGEVPLARAAGGANETAHLAAAVGAFFENGGRRCWVVRVAGPGASTNVFPVPGLLRVAPGGQVSPAFAAARSPGSWSDATRVAAGLLTEPLSVLSVAVTSPASPGTPGSLGAPAAAVDLEPRTPVAAGDLVRLTAGDFVLMFVVASAVPADRSTALPPGGPVLRVAGTKLAWFRATPPAPVPPPGTVARSFDREAPSPAAATSDPSDLPDLVNPVRPDPDGLPAAVLAWSFAASADKTAGVITLRLDAAAEVPDPGALLRVDAGGEQLWLTVASAQRVQDDGSPPGLALEVTGTGLWFLRTAPPSLPARGEDDLAQALTFELRAGQAAGQAGGQASRLSDLGFDSAHPRFWGALPSDADAYDPTVDPLAGPAPLNYAGLWQDAASADFPLAGDVAAPDPPDGAFFVPVGMSALAGTFLGPVAAGADPSHRDGLDHFGPELFLDPDPTLLDADVVSLAAVADFIQYQSPSPRLLRGIYAVLAIDEATLVAVPDAVHRPWVVATAESPPGPRPSDRFVEPARWHLRSCDGAVPANVEAPPWRFFLNCDARVLSAPTFVSPPAADATGSFTLTWTSATTAPTATTVREPTFHLEEATQLDWSDAKEVYAGGDTRFAAYGRPPGVYYYRVRIEAERAQSNWSAGVTVSVSTDRPYVLDESADPAPALLAVHRALLRACAARGDLLAVLSLPADFRAADAVTYAAELAGAAGLTASGGPTVVPGAAGIRPLGFGESAALGFGAVYHPWLVTGSGSSEQLHSLPPDGAAAGLIARRSITRGAWVAPAGEPAASVVDLLPPLGPADWQALLDAGVNPFAQQPHGFVALGADTLGDDPEVRPINVRRLLMLVRRLALRAGPGYVFEPNDDGFRRSVVRGFRAALDLLFVRGAFAGATADTSYRVSAPTSQADRDAGRFVLELRIAPSRPLTFVTVRLVRDGDTAPVVQEQS